MPPAKILTKEEKEEIRASRGTMAVGKASRKFGIGTQRLQRIWNEEDVSAGEKDEPTTSGDEGWHSAVDVAEPLTLKLDKLAEQISLLSLRLEDMLNNVEALAEADLHRYDQSTEPQSFADRVTDIAQSVKQLQSLVGIAIAISIVGWKMWTLCRASHRPAATNVSRTKVAANPNGAGTQQKESTDEAKSTRPSRQPRDMDML